MLKYKTMKINTNIVAAVINQASFNQKQIASRLDVSTSTVSAWSKGATIPQTKKVQLLQLLGMSIRNDTKYNEHELAWELFVKSTAETSTWHSYMKNFDVSLHPEWQQLLLALNDIGVPMDVSPEKPLCDPIVFRKLIRALLVNFIMLDRWCDTFLPKTKDGELTNTSQKIKNRLLDVAFLNEKIVNLVSETGTDVDKLIEKNNEIRSEVNNLIGLLCDELLVKGSSISTDYFEFVKLSPNQLQERIRNYEIHKSNNEPHIYDYLRYGEKKLLQRIETLTKTQNEFVKRIQKNEQLLKQILDEISVRQKPKKQSRKDATDNVISVNKSLEKISKEAINKEDLVKIIGQKKFDEIRKIILEMEE